MIEKKVVFPTTHSYNVWANKEYYVDKTGELIKMQELFAEGSAIFFSRPRRWWKSLFLSMIKYFFSEEHYKSEFFENKLITKDKELMKRAWKAFVISLDLKELYDRETEVNNFDKLFIQIFKQLDDTFFEELFLEKKPKLNSGYIKFVKLLKDSWEKLWTFIKNIVEIKSEEQEVFLLIDEYDKPVSDCLKDNKWEKQAEAVLENLKNNIYTFLKWIPATTILTWVHKLSMTSFFSEFNNLKDYSYLINIWFTQKEVKKIFNILNLEYSDEIKRWYNWYNYEAWLEYNPWSVISYLEKQKIDAYWSKTWTSPKYFRYLINDILKVRNFEEFLDLIKEEKYRWAVVNLEYINEKNKNLILHYLHYAGLLTVTEEDKFAIPNNDVLYSYENLLFLPVETDLYYWLRDKSSKALLKLKETVAPLKDFIKFLLKEKYLNHDKKDLVKIWEQIITSDVALFYKTFARIDLRREVNILEGRTDLEYYDEFNKKILFEFKVLRKSSELNKKRDEAIEQVKRYNKLSNYDRSYIIIVDLEKLEVEVEEII